MGSALVGSNPAVVVQYIFFLLTPAGLAHAEKVTEASLNRVLERFDDRITQGSVQIVLIFRLLLKITVDWPFHAISLSL